MLTINVTLVAFHAAIVERITALGSDPAKVLANVNAQLTGLEVDKEKSTAKLGFASTKGNSKQGPQITVKSVDKRTSIKVNLTYGLRLAEINEYLNEAAELFTRIDVITLPQSVETWITAAQFKGTPTSTPTPTPTQGDEKKDDKPLRT